jgi:ATP-dependent helicase/nuclease subunit A
MFEDLTLQQFCALDYNRNMVVTSGPGAGKTRILSHRFCFILLTDHTVTIPQILTLTFTEKAAEEMKSRIYGMLVRLERDIGKTGDDLIIKRIRGAREKFNKNRISTIHSFCADMLREHPVESAIDPGYTILQGGRRRNMMEEAVESALSSIRKSNKEILMPLFQSFGGVNNIIRAVCNVIDHPLTFERVAATTKEFFGKKRWANKVLRDYCRLIKDKEIMPYLEGLRAQDDGKGDQKVLLEILEGWQEAQQNDQEMFGIPALFGSLRNLFDKRRPGSTIPAVKEGIRKIDYVDMVARYYPDIFINASPDLMFEKEIRLFMEVAKICRDRYREEKEKINTLDFADLEARAYHLLSVLHEEGGRGRLDRIRQRYRYIMVDEFQDTNRVQWDIIRLLCSGKGEGGEEDLIEQGKLFVVGDKRQAIYGFRGGDVTVFESVTERIRASNPERPVPMFWEDPDLNDRIMRMYRDYPETMKRHAGRFESLPRQEKDDILRGSIYLPHNYRSYGRPIEFFNRAFREIFGNKGAERLKRYETAPKMISMPEETREERENEGSVTVYLTRGSSERRGRVEGEAMLITDIIENILGRNGKENREYNAYPDIREKIEKDLPAVGILFFTFRHLKTFESVLREAGLPFTVHRGKGFFRCQEVMEMVQLLNYLVDERQKISLLAALRSPIFGLTDPEIFDLFYGRTTTLEQFQASEIPYVREAGANMRRWRFLSGRLSAAGLIRTIIADRSLTAVHSAHPNGLQRMANMEKLMETARRFQAEDNGSLREFVRHCLRMTDEEEEEGEALVISGEESPISLMTIHAAKGLEFPMVIIPDLDWRVPARTTIGRPVRLYSCEDCDPEDWNYREGEVPVWQVEVPQLDYEKTYGPLGYLLRTRNRLEDMAENRRVFYVGCTRAKKHLILVSSVRKGMTEGDRAPLTSDDYRERATILDILDDIYGFSKDPPTEQSRTHEGEVGRPCVVWAEPRSRVYRGIRYREKDFSKEDFGVYDQCIRELDLTGPIQPPPYLQLSFKAFRMFRQSPVRFYFNFVLGVKAEDFDRGGLEGDEWLQEEGGDQREVDKEEYGSEAALFLGHVIHSYLEKHQFGDPLREDLVEDVWERATHSGRGGKDLEKDTLLRIREKAFRQLSHTTGDERLIRLLGGNESHAEVPFLFSARPGIEFRGVIDRLLKDEEKGHWTIIDWKSNDLEGRKPEDVAEENDYHLQLACYRWAVESILNEKVGQTYIYFTDKGSLLESRRQIDPGVIIDEMLEKTREYEEKGCPENGLPFFVDSGYSN